MFSSFFTTVPPVDPDALNFHPVSSSFKPDELFGELAPRDQDWVCPGGFGVETRVYYNVLEDGTSLSCELIHSAVGGWYPTVHFVCKIAKPNSPRIWKSVNITNFVTPPPGLDKQSSKGDQYSITYKSNPDSDTPESYIITANLGEDLQISLEISRTKDAPSFKVGKGPKGGYSYFGTDLENPEGYVMHRFWPRTMAKGTIMLNGKALDVKGPGMYVHAVQGMRPNLVASRWNFVQFQSNQHGGVSAIQMEFTTTDAYGTTANGKGFVTVNVGSLVVAGKLVGVTAETRYKDEPLSENAEVVSRATHTKTALDADTGYHTPTEILFQWGAPSLLPDVPGRFEASIRYDLGQPDAYKGLVEKVDVLGEIPYVIKTIVNYVASTKPYIYQWNNPGTLTVTGPDALIPGLSKGLEVEGWLYNEASFIS